MTAPLEQLERLARALTEMPATQASVTRLLSAIDDAAEPFVWQTLDLKAHQSLCPPEILSAWIFVLKRDVPSGAHFHPNSVQHMITLQGQGDFEVGDASGELVGFDEQQAMEQRWLVIPAGTPHEFFPRGGHLVVLSLHTCAAEELQEIAIGSGNTRNYV